MPFVVYSETIEPLLEISKWAKKNETLVFNVRIWDNWFRGHQVLPGRTHPFVKMSATGGYLLSGYKLSNVRIESAPSKKLAEKMRSAGKL